MSRKRGVVHKKEQKGRTRDKKGKPENTPKVLNAVGEHSLLERQLGIKEKHVSCMSEVRHMFNKHIKCLPCARNYARSWDIKLNKKIDQMLFDDYSKTGTWYNLL